MDPHFSFTLRDVDAGRTAVHPIVLELCPAIVIETGVEGYGDVSAGLVVPTFQRDHATLMPSSMYKWLKVDEPQRADRQGTWSNTPALFRTPRSLDIPEFVKKGLALEARVSALRSR